MNQMDLEKFQKGVELVQFGRNYEAHNLFNDLRQANPGNMNVLLWHAYTATDLTEAKNTVQEAANFDPVNPEIIRASNWVEGQQKQRLGKRFRGDITGAFVPPLPAELKNVQAKSNLNLVPATSPLNVGTTVHALTPTSIEANVAVNTTTKVIAEADDELVKPGIIKQNLPKSKSVKPVKVKKPVILVSGYRKFSGNFKKILVRLVLAVVLLALVSGGLLLIQPVRETVFNTGPLNPTEQSFVSDATTINDLATTKINLVYNCIINVPAKICTVEDGYKQAYVGLGDVLAKFQALKNPSSRFDGPYNSLLRAYLNLGTTSNFAFDSINQHKMLANQVEISSRLDEGRKLLEQGKAELKNVAQQFGPKR